MLVLSRQKDESIVIGAEDQENILKKGEIIEITIVEVRGDKVRLGITHPKHISVHRREVYDAIKKEKETEKKE